VSIGNGPLFSPASLLQVQTLEGKSGSLQPAENDASGPPLQLTAPAEGQELINGQTVRVIADASGTFGRVEFFVNGTLVSTDEYAPYDMLFTVPGYVTSLAIRADALLDDRVVTSTSKTVRVVSDRGVTIAGRVVNAEGRGIEGAKVRVAYHGLHADYFDFHSPLLAVPDLSQETPAIRRAVSAVNTKNPMAMFGFDPLGLNMRPDFAARYEGWFLAPLSGEYVFDLLAQAAAQLRIGGQMILASAGGDAGATVFLEAGPVPVEILHYDNIGTNHLEWFVTPPGGPRQVVPPEALWNEDDALAAITGPDGAFTIPGVPISLERIKVVGEAPGGNLVGVSSEAALPGRALFGEAISVIVPLAPRNE
jgi:hypothetical protein